MADEREQLYLKHKKDAHQLAWAAARRYHRPLEETKDHAEYALALIVCEHLGKYDPERAPFEHWIRSKIHWHLVEVLTRGAKDFRRREKASSKMMGIWERRGGGATVKDEEDPRTIHRRDRFDAPKSIEAKPDRFQTLIGELGTEGAALLRILRDLPSDLWEDIRPGRGKTPKVKETNLRGWLIDVADWDESQVDKAFEDVKASL